MAFAIAILAPSSVPFQAGGAEKLWWGMRRALADCSGICAELIKIPARENSFAEIVESYKTFSRIDLSHFDMLVSTRYPAWIARHANHVCYMQHTLRGLYDTYHFTGLPELLPAVPAPLADLVGLVRKPEPDRADLEPFFDLCERAMRQKSLPSSLFNFPGPLIREVVHFLDRIAFAGISAWLAISGTVARRKDYLPPGASFKVLPHPSDITDFKCAEGRYFFTASRLNGSKRLGLVIDAMKLVPGDVQLKIAGDGPDLDSLRARAASDPRISFLGRVSDAGIVDLYAGAIAVPFVPLDEDYGLITIEAMHSGKPVITTSDSGGVREMVKDGQTGFVVEPVPRALARAMTRLNQDRALAAEMGARARANVAHITWPETVRAFLDYADLSARGARRKILVAAPFQARVDGAGGERRFWHFLADLAKEYDVEVVAMGSKILSQSATRQIMANVRETLLPWPDAALAEAEKLIADFGISGDDIALMRHARDSLALKASLQAVGAGAVCAVLSHPWLYEAVASALPGLPVVYDAYNVEADLKRSFYGPGQIAAETEALELALCNAAGATFACSPEDRQRFAAFQADPGKLHVLPPGCDAEARTCDKAVLRRRLAYPDSTLALFLGSGHKPNIEAALAIIAMAKDLPDVEFLLGGTVTTQVSLTALPKPANVHFLGELTEKSKNVLLQAVDIGLNPVSSGSGVNLKTIEYLAYGLPFIATPFGMRGIPGDFAPLAHVCEIAQFPETLARLVANPPDGEAMARAGSEFREKWAWQEVLKPLRPALAEMLDRIHASSD